MESVNLQILKSRRCRECQQCRRALPAIARRLSSSAASVLHWLIDLVPDRTVFALELVREGTGGPLVRTCFDVDAQHAVRVGARGTRTG